MVAAKFGALGMKMSDNKIESVIHYFHQKLDALYGSEEVESFFWILLAHELGWKRLDWMKNPDLRLTESQLLTFIAHSRRLLKNEPVQYITGESHFMDLTLSVNSSVLIPRPETEELVNWMGSTIQNSTHLEVIDIGTGSGCIALSLKRIWPEAYIKGVDIMGKALEVAQQNGDKNNLMVDWQLMDALNMPRDVEKYDVVVSNPPYVLDSEKQKMRANVLDFEPHKALFVDDSDPLLYYEAISQWASNSLKKGGMLFFEINEKYAEETKQLLNELGFSGVEVKKDLFDKYRMVKATR